MVAALVLMAVAATAAGSVADDFLERADVLPDLPCRVFRFDLDVTGDGRDEVFLASSQNSGQHHMIWDIYSPREGGAYRHLDTLSFGYPGFFFQEEPPRFVIGTWGPWEEAQGPEFLFFEVTPSGFRRVAEIGPSSRRYEGLFEQLGKWRRPPAASLECSLLRESSPDWIPWGLDAVDTTPVTFSPPHAMSLAQ